MLMIRLTARVTGKVQGVFYRSYIQDAATAMQLTGRVQNMSDGSVEVVAEGMPETLKEFVEYLNEGSLQSEVAGVAIEWGTATRKFDEFSMIA